MGKHKLSKVKGILNVLRETYIHASLKACNE